MPCRYETSHHTETTRRERAMLRKTLLVLTIGNHRQTRLLVSYWVSYCWEKDAKRDGGTAFLLRVLASVLLVLLVLAPSREAKLLAAGRDRSVAWKQECRLKPKILIRVFHWLLKLESVAIGPPSKAVVFYPCSYTTTTWTMCPFGERSTFRELRRVWVSFGEVKSSTGLSVWTSRIAWKHRSPMNLIREWYRISKVGMHRSGLENSKGETETVVCNTRKRRLQRFFCFSDTKQLWRITPAVVKKKEAEHPNYY